MKYCLSCGKELIIPKTTNQYLISNFRLKKFCNEECRLKYNNTLKRNKYILKETEHNLKLKELNQLIKGNLHFTKGKKDFYNPDLIKENIDYELELFRNVHHFKEKIRKSDKTRKHVLVLAISDQTKEIFDEVYFFTSDKNLIKEK